MDKFIANVLNFTLSVIKPAADFYWRQQTFVIYVLMVNCCVVCWAVSQVPQVTDEDAIGTTLRAFFSSLHAPVAWQRDPAADDETAALSWRSYCFYGAHLPLPGQRTRYLATVCLPHLPKYFYHLQQEDEEKKQREWQQDVVSDSVCQTVAATVSTEKLSAATASIITIIFLQL